MKVGPPPMAPSASRNPQLGRRMLPAESVNLQASLLRHWQPLASPRRCPAWKGSPPCLPGLANLAQAESRKIVRPSVVRISTAAMSPRVRELAPITMSSRLGSAFQVATCSALP